MADAFVSAVAERIIALIEEQIRNEVNLVRGVKKEIRSLSYELKQIINVLDDAENRRFKEKNINNWLSRLEQTSYEMDDILDEWNYAILKLKMEDDQSNDDAVVAPPKQKVRSFIPSSCLCFKKVAVRHDIAKKIQNVKQQLDEIFREKDRYNFVISHPTTSLSSPEPWRVQSTSLVDLEKVHGRDRDRDILVSKLVASGRSQEESGKHIMSIVGVGGLGKTTLAQLVYNDGRVERSFDLRIWVCVSDPFDLPAIAKGILESTTKGGSTSTNQLDVLFKQVQESISGKRYLLVLDDVWTEDYNKWEPLENSLHCGRAGSKILVTTRNEKVAKIMGTMDDDIHHPGLLSEEDCWLLMRRLALFGRNEEEFENFEDTGKEIAKKCNGLPLAAKTLGSLLRFKNSLEEWENVLNSEMWEMKEMKVDLFPHLLLSYNGLSPTLKRCFSYCAVFPKDSKIDVKEVIENWMALGYLGSSHDMELEGRECFNILAMRSLFQDYEKDDWDMLQESFKMHDIVHDFAQFVRKSGRVDTPEMNKTTCQSCDPLLVSNVNEFCSLFWDDKESPPNFCDCLTRLRVLSLRKCGMQSIPQGMENLIHLRWLKLSKIKLSNEDLRILFHLYNLQTLGLKDCSLEEIPREIGNLIHLRHLDLSKNRHLKELPESICGLLELTTLTLDWCNRLSRLPEGIHRLVNLKHIHYDYATSLEELPQGLDQLTGLRSLTEFHVESGRSKLLKNLNRLSGFLHLRIKFADDSKDVVQDVKELELKKKIHIEKLEILFKFETEGNQEPSKVRMHMDVMEALDLHPSLPNLMINDYKGTKLLGWITSPLNKLRKLRLQYFVNLLSLPPFGKLPFLEEIYISDARALQFVGHEFLGIATTTTTTTTVIAFPKLKKLKFSGLVKWEEWEDITAEEEESAGVSLMPCLTELAVVSCYNLRELPSRLLRKMSSLEKLDISHSSKVQKLFTDKDGSAWKSISQRSKYCQVISQSFS